MSLQRGLERQPDRRNCVHLKQRRPMLSQRIWHHRGGSSTWLGQQVGFAAFLLGCLFQPLCHHGLPQLPLFSCSFAAVAD